VCWTATGVPVELPAAARVGLVNYQVDQNTGGSVTIYQYATQAKADAALRALRAYRCPNDAKVDDEGTIFPADQGTDFTSASRRAVANGVVYDRGDDTQGYREWVTTQIGRAVVQTEVRSIGIPELTELAAQEKANELGAFVKAWNARVVAAYRSFAVRGESR
jgi:hypothetical protein